MNDNIVVNALEARAHFGRPLRRVEDEGRSLVIEKRGRPRAILLSIRDYVSLALPEPEVLRIIGKESKRADACRADYLVTGNQRHFPGFWKNTKIISPSELLNVLAPHLF